MKKLYGGILAAAVFAMILFSPAAKADTTYDLTFTSSSNTVVGTGTMVLNTTVPGSGTYNVPLFSPDDLVSLSMTVDGTTFDLTEGNVSKITFDNGDLTKLDYDTYNWVNPSLSISETDFDYQDFIFYWDNVNIDGTVSAVDPVEVTGTPEPAALLMLASGLMGLIGFGLRRKQFAL